MLASAALGVVIALTAAACGGKSGPSGGSPATTAGSAATVSAGSTKLGSVLVDGQGRTLYLFEKDKGPMSTCSGACAAAWPPETSRGTPKAGSGVTASMLTTTARGDGSTQVVYHGHPLYRYAGDVKAGDTNGEGLNQFGAEWYAVSPAGAKVEEKHGKS
jgi:predicted lipoprotein with Yx(FWY)xxD motif